MSILIAGFLTVLMEVKAKFAVAFVFILNCALYIACIIAGIQYNLPYFSIVFSAGLLIFILVSILKRRS